MNRRDFLLSTTAAALAGNCLAETTNGWRTFEVETRIEILHPSGRTRIWLPASLIRPAPYQRTISNRYTAEGGTARLVEAKPDSLGIVAAEFPAGVKFGGDDSERVWFGFDEPR